MSEAMVRRCGAARYHAVGYGRVRYDMIRYGAVVAVR